jgi:poly(A) polymerase
VEPVRRIAPPAWMQAEETRAVIAALTADGSEVRFVGGCVRDALHARKESDVMDIDIATPDRPPQVIALLDRAGIKNIPTGLAHGTVTAVVDHRHFEITTLRVDVATHGRHADVAFTDDWVEDAARRDFTMNALFCSAAGEIYDPWGGIADLEAGRVRFVGEAAKRIEEDHLRLLRFFRFHAWYGKGAPDAEGLAAATDWAKSLAKLSGERIRAEMLKLLAAPDPAPVIAAMVEVGVLGEAVPGARDAEILRALVPLEQTADPLRRLAALLLGAATASAVHGLAQRLRLSNAESSRLATILFPPEDFGGETDERTLRRELYRHGAEAVTDWLLLVQAARGGAAERFDALRAAAQAWRPVAFPVRGSDALALGMEAGPEMGAALAAVEAWWIAEDFAPDRDACLAKLREVVAAS